METVVVAGLVLEEQRCGPRLPGPMTSIEIRSESARIAGSVPERLVPAVRDFGEMRVERRPQALDDVGQGIGEIPVLALSEAMACHDDPTAKPLVDLIEPRQPRA